MAPIDFCIYICYYIHIVPYRVGFGRKIAITDCYPSNRIQPKMKQLIKILCILKIIGVVLMYWSNWQLALFLTLLPQVIGYQRPIAVYRGEELKWGLIRNDTLKALTDIAIIPVSFYGIWSFPHLNSELMHVFAFFAGILFTVYLLSILFGAASVCAQKLKSNH